MTVIKFLERTYKQNWTHRPKSEDWINDNKSLRAYWDENKKNLCVHSSSDDCIITHSKFEVRHPERIHKTQGIFKK